MFKYAPDSEARCYRPSLHTIIQRWLAAVPAEAWQYFGGFRVGECGEFICVFMKAAATGGPLRPITVLIDAEDTYVYTDTHTFHDPYPATLSMRTLNRAADTI